VKKLLLAGVSLVALAAALPAHAAPPPPPMVPMPAWAGWYAGANAGYSFGNANQSFLDNGFSDFEGPASSNSFAGHHRMDGFIGGGQVGYNWLLPSAVAGFEADFQGANEKGSISYSTDCEGPNAGNVGSCNVHQQASIDWFGTVRGRFGWLISPTVMPYVTAGLAYGEVKTSGNVTLPAPACFGAGGQPCSFSWSKSGTNVGFAGGFGVEAFFPGSTTWSWKVEYLYINLGSLSFTGIDPVFNSSFGGTTSFTDNIIRGGVNVHLP
jgi:outer membrane immunogenic protein